MDYCLRGYFSESSFKSDACEPISDLFSLDVVSFPTPEHIFWTQMKECGGWLIHSCVMCLDTQQQV